MSRNAAGFGQNDSEPPAEASWFVAWSGSRWTASTASVASNAWRAVKPKSAGVSTRAVWLSIAHRPRVTARRRRRSPIGFSTW